MKKCRTCKWAKWQRTPKGSLLRNVHGICNYPPVAMPLQPECSCANVQRLNDRYGIWPDEGKECPVYEQAPNDKLCREQGEGK